MKSMVTKKSEIKNGGKRAIGLQITAVVMKRILIVGAGVSGLSSAVCIQKTLPDVNVTLMSEHFPPEDIVSMVAGGLVLVAPRPNLPSDAMR